MANPVVAITYLPLGVQVDRTKFAVVTYQNNAGPEQKEFDTMEAACMACLTAVDGTAPQITRDNASPGAAITLSAGGTSANGSPAKLYGRARPASAGHEPNHEIFAK